MAILSEDECRSLLKKALSYSKADECEINLNGSNAGNIRYARNAVSTSGYISQTTMAISSAFGKKLGIVTLNEYDDSSIEKAVKASEELARLAPENPFPAAADDEGGIPAWRARRLSSRSRA